MTKNFSNPVDARSTVSTEIDRKAFVRDWIAKRLTTGKLAGSGLVGAVLTLPMLAAAQTTGEFVSATGIDGVTDVQTMPDGSAQLTMSNGSTISVPAADVQIAADGQVLVSDRIVDIAADVMAGGAGGAGGGAIVGGLAGGAGLAAAGGGGGSDGGDDGPPPLTVLNGADFQSTVLGISGGFNNDNTGIGLPEGTSSVEVIITDEDGEETTVTVHPDEEGNWTTPEADGLPQGNVTVTVTSFDEDGEEIGSTSQEFNIDTVPPTISITDTGAGEDDVLNIAEQGEGITVSGETDAEDGQTVTVMVGTEEFTTTASGGAWSVVVPATSLTALDDGTSVDITANVVDAAGNEAEEATASFETDLSAEITIETIAGDPVGAADITAADRVGGFDVTGSVTGVEDGQTVTVTVNGTDFTAPVTSGAFIVPISAGFLNGLDAGPVTLNVSASVTDVAGNAATDTPAPVAADFTGPSISIGPVPTDNGDNTLNIEERGNGFSVSGTTDRVAEGSTVTVTVNGDDLTTTVGAGGTWSVTVDERDGGAFAPNGPVTIEASVIDSATSIPASAVPLDLEVDLQPPTIEITDTGTGEDGVLNIAERDEGITISGTTDAEDGQTVTVRLFEGMTPVPGGGSTDYTATASGGNWSVDIPDTTLEQFIGAGNIRVTADVSDEAGNPAETAEQTFARDFNTPVISIDDISGDNQIGLLDVDGDLVITGTTDAEPGQDVTLTFNGDEFPGTVTTTETFPGGIFVWSATVPQSTIEAIQAAAEAGDGTLSGIAVSATVTDAAGNPADAPATTTIDADFNGPSITINDISGDNIVNLDESDDPIIISGNVNNVPDTQDVTLNVGDLAPLTVGIVGGVWQTSLTPAQAATAGLTDGATVDITADVTDGDGLPAPQATAQITADFDAPVVFFDTVAESSNPGDDITDNLLNAGALDNGMVFTGRATGAEGGTVEILRVVDGNEIRSVFAVETDGTWLRGFTSNVVDSEFPAGPGDRVQDYTVTAIDEAGNRADPVTRTITLDVTPPQILIDTVSGDDEIGLLDVQGDLDISGTTDAVVGQTVTLTFNGQTFTGSVLGGGLPTGLPNFWSVTVSQSAIETIQTEANAGDGTVSGIPITATVSDVAGNPALTPATSTISADFNGPSITIDPITGDNVINAEESGGDVTISGDTGNVGEGQTVTVSVDGTALPTVLTDPTGAWQVSLPQADLPADGTSVTITADVSDDDGIAAPTASETLSADLTAPGITFDIIRENIAGSDDPGDDGFLNATARTDGIEFIGSTTNAQEGDTVEFSFEGSDFGDIDDFGVASAVVQLDGSWRIGFTGGPISSFFPDANGEGPVDFAVVVIDAAGNRSAPVTRTMILDETPPEVTIDALESDGLPLGPVMNIAESGEDLVISGTVDGADDVTVTFNGAELTGVSVNSGGWEVTVPSVTLQALSPNATIDITAEATDTAGNTGSANESFDTDLQAPTIQITDTGVGPDDTLNIAESDAGITVTGTTTGVETGQTVTITLSGMVMATPIVATGTVTGNAFSVDFTDGDLSTIGGWPTATVTATVSDAAGNPATPATDSFDIDLVAPTIAFDDPPPNGFVLDLAERDNADGIDFTTSETVDGDVTLTFTRTDGSDSVEFNATEALADLPQDGGVFTFPLTPANVGGLPDATEFSVAISITDVAGNTGTPDTFTVETDFAPILTIDEIGEDGAVDLSDTEDAAITGTTLGVEEGNDVRVVVTGTESGVVLDAMTQVGPGDLWSLPVDAAFFEALEPGETFTVSASVSNDAGRTATDEQAGIDAYLGSAFRILETGIAGNTVTYDVLVDLDNIEQGSIEVAVATIEFDASLLTVDPFPRVPVFGDALVVEGFNDQFAITDVLDESDLGNGLFSISAISLSGPITDFSDPLFSFDAEASGFDSVFRLGVSSAQSDQFVNSDPDQPLGDSVSFFGTSGNDTITAENVDTLIQGKGGDDSIDVSASGTHIVVFELDQAGNGTDTVTGFTTGDTFQSDVIAFLGEADLRGDGDFVETLAAGEALGVNTGFVIFTTALGDTTAATLETAFENLVGEADGDVVYFLAGDTNGDAALARVEVSGTEATAEILSNFSDIGDLNQLSADNVILPDPATAPV